MNTKIARRGPHRGTVLLVVSVVGALLIGTAGGAVGASLVTSAQIKNGTIRAVDIRNNTITGAKIKKNTVASSDIKNRTILAKDIKKGVLTGALVKDGSLRGADLAAETLTGEHIIDGSVGAADLAVEVLAQWAVVNFDGTLVRSTQGVSAQKLNTGQYEVTFPESVKECAFAATIGNPVSGTPLAGMVSATPRFAKDNGVFVGTSNDAGASVDRAFHLVVHC